MYYFLNLVRPQTTNKLKFLPGNTMKIATCSIKYCRWIPLLTVCLAFGCASGPRPQNIWPWEYGKETGNHQTGDYITVGGTVGNFGVAPKAVKPITPESLKPQSPESPSPAEPAESKVSSTVPKPGQDKPATKVTSDYDFTVSDVKIAPPSYLPTGSIKPAHDITAINHGLAPVTVAIGVDPESTQNLSTDKPLPLNAVVPPGSDHVIVQFSPKIKNEPYRFRYAYSWSIGDYTAQHNCPEHYQFPFGDNIQAYASAGSDANSTPFNRYAVAFSLPPGTPVLAARKGTVVQIRDGRIDILHNDSTIASYSHLEKLAEGIVPGKVVTTRDVLGLPGIVRKQKEAYMQLTVWRPEPEPAVRLLKTNSQSPGIEYVSFPLEFCTADTNDCRVLTKDQAVSKRIRTDRKQTRRKSKTGSI